MSKRFLTLRNFLGRNKHEKYKKSIQWSFVIIHYFYYKLLICRRGRTIVLIQIPTAEIQAERIPVAGLREEIRVVPIPARGQAQWEAGIITYIQIPMPLKMQRFL
ncbi:MAG: hypothetical protein AB1498_09695 [bacterium]